MFEPKRLFVRLPDGRGTAAAVEILVWGVMGTTIAQADPRVLERAARGVPGVAFAEVSAEGDAPPALRLWLWDDAERDDTAGQVEVALRDMGLEVATGDVRVAGVARALARHAAEDDSGGVRVIDLGDGTWATEPVDPDIPPLLPVPDPEEQAQAPVRTPSGLLIAPRVAAVSVTRGRGKVLARVEIDRGDGSTFAAESRGADTVSRARRAVAEATATAAGAAIGGVAVDVEHAGISQAGVPCALVVVCAASVGTEPQHLRRSAGAAVIEDDPWRAFAVATLRAAQALR